MWHLKGSPFSVQAEAMRRGSPHLKYAYFMQMGLGKSSVALNDFVDACMRHDVLHLVVLCPNSLKENWKAEIEKFMGDAVRVFLWPDDLEKRKLKWAEIDRKPAVFIFNYESVLYSGGNHLLAFAKLYVNRFMLVADETSKIKNFKAATTKYCVALSAYAKVVRALTGTPMTNNVMDYWSQLRFIGQLNGVNPYQFRNRYAVLGGFMGKQVVGIRNHDELRTILDKCSFTATKDDWTDLPPKVYVTRNIELSKRQRELYDEMQEDLMVMLDDEAVTAPMVITCLEKLQQISSGFLIKEDGTTVDLVDMKHNPKIKETRAVIEEAGGKVLVFAKHKRAAGILRDALEEFKPAMMTGDLSGTNINNEKGRFNHDPACRVCIAQSSVGGMGHTLLGGKGKDRCATTVFFENSFSLGDRLQAEDRNHRHGQDADSVTYVDIIASAVEKKTVLALQKKINLIEALRHA